MVSKYTCIIIDDETKAIKLLADQITALYKNIEIVGTFTSWEEALDALRANNFDILFLDISMPHKNGISLLKLVPELQSEIVFVTAYSDYALEAFNFSATGYILKPTTDQILTKVVDKAIERVDSRKIARQRNNHHISPLLSKLGIPNNKGLDYVNFDDILYFEAITRYTKVVTKDSKILSSYSIGKFSELVAGLLFYMVHRSFIVNMKYIHRYESSGIVIMSNGAEIPVARNARENFFKLLDKVSRNIDLAN